MGRFKEWLREQAEKERTVSDRRRLIEEWTDAVAALFAQMVRWLAEDDTQQVLTVETGKIEKMEEDLGPYEVAVLRIHLASRSVDLIPQARNVVGGVGPRGDLGFRAAGRVDMTNGARKYLLYRAVMPDEKKWVIVQDIDYRTRDLDKEAFEEALQDLLS